MTIFVAALGWMLLTAVQMTRTSTQTKRVVSLLAFVIIGGVMVATFLNARY